MTKRSYILAFIILTFAQLACGQTRIAGGIAGPPAPGPVGVSTPEIDRAKLKTQAEELNEAFVGGNFDKVADLTYPGLVRRIGGRTQMVAFLRQNMKEMQAQGFDLLSVSVDEPKQVIKIGGQIFSILPTTMRAKTPRGVLVGKSFLIGVSDDGGEKWTFVDGSIGVDEQKLHVLLPAAADKLELPQEQPPVLEAGKK